MREGVGARGGSQLVWRWGFSAAVAAVAAVAAADCLIHAANRLTTELRPCPGGWRLEGGNTPAWPLAQQWAGALSLSPPIVSIAPQHA